LSMKGAGGFWPCPPFVDMADLERAQKPGWQFPSAEPLEHDTPPRFVLWKPLHDRKDPRLPVGPG